MSTTAFILPSFSLSLFLSTIKPLPVTPLRRKLVRMLLGHSILPNFVIDQVFYSSFEFFCPVASFTSDFGVFFRVAAFIAFTIIDPSPPSTSTTTYTGHIEHFTKRLGEFYSKEDQLESFPPHQIDQQKGDSNGNSTYVIKVQLLALKNLIGANLNDMSDSYAINSCGIEKQCR
ncbi:unnamed protein product [Lactuca saligna]|uniref:Uncharacterized protein n=1 Tax=Lactuca saligna TaxID=75948 RepID=A0AA35ZL25_LACSI|nr:unnamed protein product [Lactuca saligna]